MGVKKPTDEISQQYIRKSIQIENDIVESSNEEETTVLDTTMISMKPQSMLKNSNTKQRPPTDDATRQDIRLNRLYRSAILDKAPRTMISQYAQYDIEHRLRGNIYEEAHELPR
eukprot:scaffold127_cov187-Alexandrium_tamarense.AAC.4